MIKATSLLLALASFFTAAQAQDVAAGKQKAAMCIGCHGIPGYQATFPQVHKVPMIAGQGAGYIAAALNGYASGERKHPTMRGIAASLTEKDIADLSAFYEQLGKGNKPTPPEAAATPPAKVAELLTKGACVSCHGPNFSKPVAPNYPKVAGQYSDYLTVALTAYQHGDSALAGRGNAIMAGQVKQFSPAELKQIANYLASLPGELQTVPQSRFR